MSRSGFDVAVVGAGPAGSACAAVLARGGARCLVIDGEIHPSGKPCGGAVSPGAARILSHHGLASCSELSSLALATHSAMSCHWKGRLLRTYRSGSDPVTMVDRIELDRFLLEKALSAGAVVIRGDRVLGLLGLPPVLAMRSGTGIEVPVVVGADGAGSRIRRSLGLLEGSPGGFGVECFVATPPGLEHEMQIHFGLTPFGYGWVFPRGPDTCVGIGAICGRSSPRRLAEALGGLLSAAGFPPVPGRGLRAAPLPGFGIEMAPVPGRVYLCGDAAGLVDRLTGEGIGHAVESGALAARAILEGWGGRRLAKEAARGCAGIVRQSRLARLLVYHPLLEREAMRRLEAKDKFYAGYWELISGRIDYRGLLWSFLRSR